MPSSPLITTASNSSREARAVVAVGAPGVREQAGAHALALGERDRGRTSEVARMPPNRRSMSPSRARAQAEELRRSAARTRARSSSPVSSSNSGWRAVGSSRNTSRTSVGVEALGVAERGEGREDVRRSARRRSRRAGRAARVSRQGPSPRRVGELDHAVAELLQERVVGRARDRALVVALHEDDRLPQRERRGTSGCRVIERPERSS